MGVALDSLRLALPSGSAWRKIAASPLALALGDVLEAARETIHSIAAEAHPGTASATLPEWHETLGIKYDASRPLDEQRARLEATRLSVGGMTLSMLQAQVSREYPGVTVSEVPADPLAGDDECGVSYCGGEVGDYSPLYYDVSGELADDYEALRVGAIVAHFAPLHLVACSSLTIAGISATSEAGLALCGVEEAGSDD